MSTHIRERWVQISAKYDAVRWLSCAYKRSYGKGQTLAQCKFSAERTMKRIMHAPLAWPREWRNKKTQGIAEGTTCTLSLRTSVIFFAHHWGESTAGDAPLSWTGPILFAACETAGKWATCSLHKIFSSISSRVCSLPFAAADLRFAFLLCNHAVRRHEWSLLTMTCSAFVKSPVTDFELVILFPRGFDIVIERHIQRVWKALPLLRTPTVSSGSVQVRLQFLIITAVSAQTNVP